jgi:hypothetical protein
VTRHERERFVTSELSNSSEDAVLALARKRPLLRARDLAEHSLPTVTPTRLVAAGKLERVSRGVYSGIRSDLTL